jgi:arabinogalactan endo-1,4-beta-galactosidase
MHKALEAHKEDAMSAKQVQMNVESNLGYAADQIKTSVTLADLLEQVQEAIVEWGEDAVVVLHQTNNGYGANYGKVSSYDLFNSTDSDEDLDPEDQYDY